LDIFTRLLRDTEGPVRVGAAFLLATMSDRRPGAASALFAAIDDEPDDRTRGAFFLALMVLAERSPEDPVAEAAIRRFHAGFDEEDGAHPARLGAGIALMHMQKRLAFPQVLALARRHLATEREIFLDLPWDEHDDLFALVDAGLRLAPEARIDWIIEGLQHRDPNVRDRAMECGGELCCERRGGPAALRAPFGRLVDDPAAAVRKRAIHSLAGMGKEGTEFLKGLLGHRLPDVRAEVAEALQRARSREEERASWLLERRPLVLPPVWLLLRIIDGYRGSLRFDDEQRVRDAVVRLGFYGPKAVKAVKWARGLCSHESPWIRAHAIRGLWKITGDPPLIVPLLRANLRPEPVAFLIVDCLKQIGPAAGEALPELRRIVDSEDRYFTTGFMDDICATDDAFREASLQTLRAIDH
jgi:HEAT repeat protein